MPCTCPPVSGGYSAWGQFGVCSGLPICSRSRSRSCTNPPPSNGGANCTVLGPEVEARTCSSCQRDGAPLLSDAVLTGDDAQMNALAYSRGWKTESEWDADREVSTYEDVKVWRLAFFILVPILLVAALGMALMYHRRVKRWNQLYSPRGQAPVLPSSPSVQMSPMAAGYPSFALNSAVLAERPQSRQPQQPQHQPFHAFSVPMDEPHGAPVFLHAEPAQV